MDALFHVSEQGGIARFHPRPAPSYHGMENAAVWAIAEPLLHNYLLPRDCPRVTYYALPDSKTEDVEKFMGYTDASFVMAIEASWLPRVLSTRLYCYEMPPETFALKDGGAGYYVSREAVTPVSVSRIDHPLEEIGRRHVEIRITPSLWDLCDAVVKSSLQYSMIRMRNASPRSISKSGKH